MIISLRFVSHDKKNSFHLTRTMTVESQTPVSEVEVLKDPLFEIIAQATPGSNRRKHIAPTFVSNDSVVGVSWRKLITRSGNAYNNEVWIKRRLKQLVEAGWQIQYSTIG